MAWFETLDGDYINLSHVRKLDVAASGPVWRINALIDGSVSGQLKGEYTSEADAKAAVQKLVHAYDPTLLTGG